ncbi:MAG: polysaccharide deacetylase family protein [Sedimentisphaerales bacterium]|nr:polysaccharide deacetylase family protein [Sedimentisphaerales bacterium]
MKPIVVFGFDMETDIGSWTPFYEGLVNGTPEILSVLQKHDVKSTFFFTGDAARSNPDIVNMVSASGHEVGCHSLYHETLGDELIPIPGLRPVLPEECYHRVEVATKIVEEVAGRKMHSFRAPRLWGSTALVNALEDLGYKADASYPMFFHEERVVPYHPSKENWLAEGDMKILEIPNFADMTIVSADVGGRDRDQWPKFRTEGADAIMKHIRNMLDFYKRKNLPAVLCFYLHPWEFWPMPEGLIHFGEGSVMPDPFIIKNCGEVAIAELDKWIQMLKEMEIQFTTAVDLVDFRGKIHEQG